MKPIREVRISKPANQASVDHNPNLFSPSLSCCSLSANNGSVSGFRRIWTSKTSPHISDTMATNKGNTASTKAYDGMVATSKSAKRTKPITQSRKINGARFIPEATSPSALMFLACLSPIMTEITVITIRARTMGLAI